MMGPILPIAALVGAYFLLRKPPKAAEASSADAAAPSDAAAAQDGAQAPAAMSPAEKVEFRRRKELEALLGRRRGAAAPPKVEIPEGLKPCLDENIAPELLAELITAWQSTTLTALNLAEVAQTLTESGFVKAAACFAKKADELLAKKGGLPHTIRSGDIPSLLATYYTGDARRFKELGTVNKQLGKLITTNGVTNFAKWIVGTEILIPADWKPLAKPVPPLASAAPKDSQLPRA